jgi:hypothetical protein
MPLPDYIPAATAARILGKSASALSHAIKRGRLKGVRRQGPLTDLPLVEVIRRLGRPLSEDERQLVERGRWSRQPIGESHVD